MDTEIFKILGTLVTVLFLFRARKRKKRVEQRASDPRGYDPIEPESGKAVEGAARTAESALKIHSIIIALVLFGVMGYLFFTESLTRWIIVN